ncbi:hypothetical protein F4777DRAFT_302369 [Nemania sp. FL0916]|nr:hypothetical protein F4777DRAFT_302369 [Nemania sp. FL0916]
MYLPWIQLILQVGGTVHTYMCMEDRQLPWRVLNPLACCTYLGGQWTDTTANTNPLGYLMYPIYPTGTYLLTALKQECHVTVDQRRQVLPTAVHTCGWRTGAAHLDLARPQKPHHLFALPNCPRIQKYQPNPPHLT